ncbi:MAG: hypothetical protein K0R29_498 [Pseudobdellovibrio sp.]|nr:hypothetical protein [Pseudobdellovibrio sp.]
MTLNNVTILIFASSLSTAAVAGLNEAHIPMVPPPYQMAETPKQTATDRQLTEKVQQQLVSKVSNYNPESKMIVSQKGEIILQGKVSSPEEEKQILEAVRKVKGVAKIKNKMVVISSAQQD